MAQQQRQYALRDRTETDENDSPLEFEIFFICHFINWCCRFSGTWSLTIFVRHAQHAGARVRGAAPANFLLCPVSLLRHLPCRRRSAPRVRICSNLRRLLPATGPMAIRCFHCAFRNHPGRSGGTAGSRMKAFAFGRCFL
jgi:hypothetical protein